ncbi:hypothetical protein V5F77_00965 [Xanthobacter sp. DSM 24535]|uniref:hypothetical protein n=1 Tax=Roseixanthobacter psychrophilus TaxID=3119917 RepID=UPI00372BE905
MTELHPFHLAPYARRQALPLFGRRSGGHVPPGPLTRMALKVLIFGPVVLLAFALNAAFG